MAKKYGQKASEKVKRSMEEMKAGKLKSGRSGKKVTDRKQAIAIGLSEAREAGGKVPSPESTTKSTAGSPAKRKSTGSRSKSSKTSASRTKSSKTTSRSKAAKSKPASRSRAAKSSRRARA